MRIGSAAAAAKVGCVLLLAQGVAAKAAEVTVLFLETASRWMPSAHM